MIKILIFCSSVLYISACSQSSWDTENEFEAGYDAGYIKGYAAGQDQNRERAHSRETDTVMVSDDNGLNNSDTIGSILNDPKIDLPGVYPQFDSSHLAGSDSIFRRGEDYSIYDNSEIVQNQEPAVIIPSRRVDRPGIFTTGLSLYVMIILLLLTLIFLQLLNLKRKSMEVYGNTKILKDIAKSQRITKNIDLISNRLTRIESEIIKLSENQEVQNKQQIEDPVQELNTYSDETAVTTSEGAEIAESDNKPVTFFMPSPDNNGNFDNRKKSDHFIPSVSVYKFVMNEDSDNTAEFYIYQDPNNMERAINYYSSILKKVCKSETAFDPMGKSIVTLEPGLAVLTGNQWVVKEKALVKYE
jgi:hypothetical protein